MPYIPQKVPTDYQILATLLALGVFSIVMWFLSNWMKRYAERKEKEIEGELKELEDTGDVF